jgi:hypothetical protein
LIPTPAGALVITLARPRSIVLFVIRGRIRALLCSIDERQAWPTSVHAILNSEVSRRLWTDCKRSRTHSFLSASVRASVAEVRASCASALLPKSIRDYPVGYLKNARSVFQLAAVFFPVCLKCPEGFIAGRAGVLRRFAPVAMRGLDLAILRGSTGCRFGVSDQGIKVNPG